MTKLARETLADIIFGTRTRNMDLATSAALASAIITGLDRRGKVIADVSDVIEPPDEHLQMLKKLRNRIMRDIESEDTAPRDLAALTNRMQALSKEIGGIEDRVRAENKVRGAKSNGKSDTRTTAAATSGSLDI